MADIQLTQDQVKQASAAPSIPKLDQPQDSSGALPQEQLDVILPAKRLEIQGESEPTPTMPTPGDRLNDNQVARLKMLLDKLDSPTPTQQPQNLPPTIEGLPRVDELGVPAPNQVSSDIPTTPPPTEVTTFDLPNDENATKFKQAFEKYLGFPLEDLKTYSQQYAQAVGELQRIRGEQNYTNSVNQLAQNWGVDTATAEGRLDQIQKRFALYSKDMQARLDNVEGAKLIWSRLEAERQARENSIPQFQSSRAGFVPNNNNNWMFSESQLDAMSPEEYERNADKIFQAYQLRLVKPA